MSVIYAAYRAGISTRAMEILDDLTEKPTQEIRSGAGQLWAMWRGLGR